MSSHNSSKEIHLRTLSTDSGFKDFFLKIANTVYFSDNNILI